MDELMQPDAPDFPISRRRVITAIAAGAIVSTTKPVLSNAAPETKIQAIAFDAFPIFDPRAVAARAQALFPEKGQMLASVWTAKLFDYTWLLTSARRYEGFETLARASLQFAADTTKVELPAQSREELVAVYSNLTVWPDVKPALERLRAAGIRLLLLSNLSEAMLRANLRGAGIEQYFEPPLSTDGVRQFKPAPMAYNMAVAKFCLPKEAIGFAAFGGWDAVGATWFGYRTVWVNRLGVPTEALDPKPAITSPNMDGVLALAGIV